MKFALCKIEAQSKKNVANTSTRWEGWMDGRRAEHLLQTERVCVLHTEQPKHKPAAFCQRSCWCDTYLHVYTSLQNTDHPGTIFTTISDEAGSPVLKGACDRFRESGCSIQVKKPPRRPAADTKASSNRRKQHRWIRMLIIKRLIRLGGILPKNMPFYLFSFGGFQPSLFLQRRNACLI